MFLAMRTQQRHPVVLTLSGKDGAAFLHPLELFCIKQNPIVVLLIKPIFWHLKSWHVVLESGNEIHAAGGEEEGPDRSTPCWKSNPSVAQGAISADFDFLSVSHQPLFLTKSSCRTCVCFTSAATCRFLQGKHQGCVSGSAHLIWLFSFWSLWLS